jgi:hypothetical protein
MVGALSPKPYEIICMRGPSVAQSVTPFVTALHFSNSNTQPGQIAAIGHVSALEARELRSSRQQTNGKA